MLMESPGRLTHRGLRAPVTKSLFPTITVPQPGDVTDEFIGILDGSSGLFQAFAQFPAFGWRIDRSGGGTAHGVWGSGCFCHDAAVMWMWPACKRSGAVIRNFVAEEGFYLIASQQPGLQHVDSRSSADSAAGANTDHDV